MKTKVLNLILVLILSFALTCECKHKKLKYNTANLKLKQVLVFSRHNARTTLHDVTKYTPKKWPQENEPLAQLTPRGALLEGLMGEYFKEWLHKEQFFNESCPTDETVYIYSNSLNRTLGTAEAFVDTAFKDCKVTIDHKDNGVEVSDPNFTPVVHNTTEEFKNKVIKKIKKLIKNKKLKAALLELNEILNFNQSEICKTESICDLTDFSKNNITVEVGQMVTVHGPITIAIDVVDSFLMEYFNGLEPENVAWGLIKSPKEWKLLSEVALMEHTTRYTSVAEDIATPLLKHLGGIFLNYDKQPKFILIMGHDYNQNSVLNTIGIKSFHPLPEHYEPYPMGGKVVFERWTDGTTDFLKIEYIYATWTQIRNASRLSLETPPHKTLLQLKWCKVDDNGFCPWDEFINKIKSLPV